MDGKRSVIRFIDLRNQGTYSRFAFWSTNTDEFLKFGSDQAWDDFADLAESVKLHFFHVQRDKTPEIEATMRRLTGLMPEWAFVDDGKGEEQWEAD